MIGTNAKDTPFLLPWQKWMAMSIVFMVAMFLYPKPKTDKPKKKDEDDDDEDMSPPSGHTWA